MLNLHHSIHNQRLKSIIILILKNFWIKKKKIPLGIAQIEEGPLLFYSFFRCPTSNFLYIIDTDREREKNIF